MLLDSKIIVIATRNQGKVKEFEKWFLTKEIQVRSLNDYENLPEIIEDGTTFQENARKKARTIAEALQVPVLADDSGLSVDALLGKPGVYSARYAGEQATDAMNNEKLLQELERLVKDEVIQLRVQQDIAWYSHAHFVSALALFDPAANQMMEAEGRCEGVILSKPSGEFGFGYDPLFYLPSMGKTMAELSKDEKNSISHRGKALEALFQQLNFRK